MDIDASTDRWGTALYIAAAEGDMDIIDLLLERGADPNIQKPSNRAGYGMDTPNALAAAVRGGSETTAQKLLAAGADVNAGDGAALAAAHSVSIIKLLSDAGAGTFENGEALDRLVISLAHWGNFSVCRFVLDQGVRVNAVNVVLRTALHAFLTVYQHKENN